MGFFGRGSRSDRARANGQREPQLDQEAKADDGHLLQLAAQAMVQRLWTERLAEIEDSVARSLAGHVWSTLGARYQNGALTKQVSDVAYSFVNHHTAPQLDRLLADVRQWAEDTVRQNADAQLDAAAAQTISSRASRPEFQQRIDAEIARVAQAVAALEAPKHLANLLPKIYAQIREDGRNQLAGSLSVAATELLRDHMRAYSPETAIRSIAAEQLQILVAAEKDHILDEASRRLQQAVTAEITRQIELLLGHDYYRQLMEREIKEASRLQIGSSRTQPLEYKESASTGDATHEQFATILDVARRGLNVLMVGPAGTGKSTIAVQVAKALNKEFWFNGPIQSEFKLTGFRDAAGVVHSTPFREAYARGHVYLFDELDACDPRALIAFNTALSIGYMDFPDGRHLRSPGFVCLAAANTYGLGIDSERRYMRNQLDAATLDRFVIIHVGYCKKLEYGRVDPKYHSWVQSVRAWRLAVEALKKRHVISMRASIIGASLLDLKSQRGSALASDKDNQEIEKMAVWRGLATEEIREIKAKADNLLQDAEARKAIFL